MRTVTITYYKLDELSASAKKTAIERMRSEVGGTIAEFTNDEYREALKAIEEVFGITVYGWWVDGKNQYNYKFSFDDPHTTYLRNGQWWFDDNINFYENPKFFMRWFNKIWAKVYKGKYFGRLITIDPKTHTYRHISRHSKVLSENPTFTCCLTGCYTDYAVDDAMNSAYAYVREGMTIYEFIECMLDKFFASWGEDYENGYSDESVEEHIIDNELEFYENGTPA